MESWYPNVIFEERCGSIYVLIRQGVVKVYLHDDNWIIGDVGYDVIGGAICNYLYSDLKRRESVRRYLDAGPPGDDKLRVIDLVEGMMIDIKKKYDEFMMYR